MKSQRTGSESIISPFNPSWAAQGLASAVPVQEGLESALPHVDPIPSPELPPPISPLLSHRRFLLFQKDDKADLEATVAGMERRERQEFLLSVLEHFSREKKVGQISKAVDLLLSTTSLWEVSAQDRFHFYFQAYLLTKDLGVSEARELEAHCIQTASEISLLLKETETPLHLKVQSLLSIHQFYRISGRTELEVLTARCLAAAQEEILRVLENLDNWPMEAEERLELFRQVVQIDQALLPDKIQEASAPEFPGSELGQTLLSHCRRYREAVQRAAALPFSERLEVALFLSQAISSYMGLNAGGRARVSDPEIRKESEALFQWLKPLLAEAFAQSENAPKLQKAFAAKLTLDVQDRFEVALREGPRDLWLKGLGVRGILNWAQGVQAGHFLLEEAAKGEGPQRIQRLNQAAALFARAGLQERVREALEPVRQYIDSLQDPRARAEHLLELGPLYPMAGMTKETAELFSQLIELEKTGDTSLKDLAGTARVLQALNEENFDRAAVLLREVPNHPKMQALRSQIETGRLTLRQSFGLEILGTVLDEELSGLFPKGSWQHRALGKSLASVLTETQILLARGEESSFESAFCRALRASPYSNPLGSFADSELGGRLWKFLQHFSRLDGDETELAGQALSLATTLSLRNRFNGAAALARWVEDNQSLNWELNGRAREFRESLPGSAMMTMTFFAVQELIATFNVAGNVLNHNVKMDQEFFLRAGITAGTLGIAGTAGRGAEILWLSRAKGMLASPLVLTGVRSVAQAGAVGTAEIGFASLLQDPPSDSVLSYFGKGYGSLLVLFSLLNASGLGLKAVGMRTRQSVQEAERAVARARLAGGRNLADTEAHLAGAKRIDNLVRHPATAWGTRVTTFTGGDLANEALELHEQGKGADLMTRFLSSAALDAQMTVYGKVVRAVSESYLGRLERSVSEDSQGSSGGFLPDVSRVSPRIFPSEAHIVVDNGGALMMQDGNRRGGSGSSIPPKSPREIAPWRKGLRETMKDLARNAEETFGKNFSSPKKTDATEAQGKLEQAPKADFSKRKITLADVKGIFPAVGPKDTEIKHPESASLIIETVQGKALLPLLKAGGVIVWPEEIRGVKIPRYNTLSYLPVDAEQAYHVVRDVKNWPVWHPHFAEIELKGEVPPNGRIMEAKFHTPGPLFHIPVVIKHGPIPGGFQVHWKHHPEGFTPAKDYKAMTSIQGSMTFAPIPGERDQTLFAYDVHPVPELRPILISIFMFFVPDTMIKCGHCTPYALANRTWNRSWTFKDPDKNPLGTKILPGHPANPSGMNYYVVEVEKK